MSTAQFPNVAGRMIASNGPPVGASVIDARNGEGPRTIGGSVPVVAFASCDGAAVAPLLAGPGVLVPPFSGATGDGKDDGTLFIFVGWPAPLLPPVRGSASEPPPDGTTDEPPALLLALATC